MTQAARLSDTKFTEKESSRIHYWHFRFNGGTPEAFVKGRENIYFAYFWNDLTADKNHSVPEADRKAYIEAYSRPGRMRASWEYFVSWPQVAKDLSKCTDKIDHAAIVNRWRQVVGGAAGGTSETGRDGCNHGGRAELGPLDS
ncbi:MAG: hypothetical protein M3O09_04170 [Acidobacteriota bacterium]|nr:hypothetical protein [Acidobacteriota bacterium]